MNDLVLWYPEKAPITLVSRFQARKGVSGDGNLHYWIMEKQEDPGHPSTCCVTLLVLLRRILKRRRHQMSISNPGD